MITARIEARTEWVKQFTEVTGERVKEAVEEAVKVGSDSSSEEASKRHRTGLMEEMEEIDVMELPDMYVGGWKSKAWYAHFQNSGTVTGIKPLHFLEKGRRVARQRLVERLRQIGRRA